ncbi:MAG: flavodoxin domain-containing protein [Candidatus Thorarchaeota archaeon]
MNEINFNDQRKAVKVIILYDSKFGNTKKVAITLDRGLESGGFHVDSVSIQDFNINKLRNYDVVGIGSPTHNRGLSKPMKLFLSKIKHENLKDKKGFVFETKLSVPFSGSSAKKITKYLKMMKIELLHHEITANVLGNEGPLEENTLSKMEETGLDIAEKLNNIIKIERR